MVTYVFREDEPLTIKNAKKANPQIIGKALEAIAAKTGGRLTPPAIVEAARNERHALHKHFEWDDAVAAESFRLDQARTLVRLIRVDDGSSETPRAYLSVPEKDGTSYRSLSDVQGSADLQAIVLKQAERDLDAFSRRYKELTDICELIIQAREKVAARRAKVEARPTA